MAGVAALRTALVTALGDVPNIGDVYDYERYVTKVEQADELFKNQIGSVEMIQFADVALIGLGYTLSSLSTATTWRYDAATTFRVRVFRTLNDGDASGRAFATLVEDALQAVVTMMADLTPRLARINAQVTTVEHRLFHYPGQGGVLSHYGEIVVSAPDQVVL
jgi:hypothetical protein